MALCGILRSRTTSYNCFNHLYYWFIIPTQVYKATVLYFLGMTWYNRGGWCYGRAAFLIRLRYHLSSAVLHRRPTGTHFTRSTYVLFPNSPAPYHMDKQSTVVFRNVGQLYFPQSRVECHYSLTAEHQWSSGDWIGIFEVDRPTRPTFLRSETETILLILMWSVVITDGLFVSEAVPHVHVGCCSWRLHEGFKCQLLCPFSGWESFQIFPKT